MPACSSCGRAIATAGFWFSACLRTISARRSRGRSLRQEPGSAADIAETAQHHYGATFPITAKAEVRGPNSHPFYKWAAVERPVETPHWNFHKYLIGRDGHIAAVFPTEIEPMDARVIDAVVKELDRVE